MKFRQGRGLPRHCGIAARLATFVGKRAAAAGDALISRGIELARERHASRPNALVSEWVDGVLGDHDPLPVRVLPNAEGLVRSHLVDKLFGGDSAAGNLDWFAVESASAGIAYLLQTLVRSRLLSHGGRVALGVPIFTPYLERPPARVRLRGRRGRPGLGGPRSTIARSAAACSSTAAS